MSSDAETIDKGIKVATVLARAVALSDELKRTVSELTTLLTAGSDKENSGRT